MNEPYAPPFLFQEMLRTCLYSAITLYMLIILLRWTSPFLSLDMNHVRLRWIPPLTDPLLNLIRRLLPPMGFADWTPVAAVLILWVLRVLLVQE
ncbi:MAG TPA: YggT family protein [Candidatus Hydrogenedentes bacterium]|nr:MAG: YGGT family protein [Candidatus Hydrogenedentes bacterium ADurb.Bin179]HOC67416.1 YggT family protein [Candidatus Hydrogenedentota bacterium]HQN00020.1 YggT family protein [Candidatus Hydrogenedentota bacterium]